MDPLQKELAELKEFITVLQADRAATKEKEKKEAWTKWVSLSVVIIAVISSIAAQRAGKYGSQAQMSQAQASDQWSYYQASSIKVHLYEAAREQAAAAPGSVSAKTLAALDTNIATYEKKKAEGKAEAERLEKVRDAAAHAGSRLGPAGACFTVAIAVASICLVTKKKPLWFVSLILAGTGLLFWAGIIEAIIGKA